MQTIILAAGRGTRFGEMTQATPKCLLKVLGKPIIARIMDALPKDDSNIIIVIGHLGEKVKRFVGARHGRHPVTYVEAEPTLGTAGALRHARHLLKDTFLVLNGDDIVTRASVAALVRRAPSFGFMRRRAPGAKYRDVILDQKGCVTRLAKIRTGDTLPIIRVATGAYVLDASIFRYKPVRLKSGEYGLPQTIMKMAARQCVRGVPMPGTLFINNREDLMFAEDKLRVSGASRRGGGR